MPILLNTNGDEWKGKEVRNMLCIFSESAQDGLKRP